MATLPVLLTFLGSTRRTPSYPLPESGMSQAHTWTPSNPHCLEYSDAIVWRTAPYVDDSNYTGVTLSPYDPAFDTVDASLIVPAQPPFTLSPYMASLRTGGHFYKPWTVDVPDGMNAFEGMVDYPYTQDGQLYHYKILSLTSRTLDSGPGHFEPVVGLTTTIIDDVVTLAISFQSFRHDWDSSPFHTGLTKAQLRIGTEIHDITLTATYTSTQSQIVESEDAEQGYYDVDLGYFVYDPVTHLLEALAYQQTGSIEFPFTSEPLSLRLGNDYGEWLIWNRLTYLPEAAMTMTVKDDVATFDFSASRVLGGTIGQSVGYYRVTITRPAVYTEDIAFLGTFTSTEPIFTIDFRELGHPSFVPPLGDGDLLSIESNVVTDDNCLSVGPTQEHRLGSSSRVSVAYDENRLTWWLLRAVSGNLVVERHLKHEPPDAATGVVIAAGAPGTIRCAGAHLYVISRGAHLYTSADEGQEWESVMPIASGVTLVDFIVDGDGGATRSLVLDADNVPYLVVTRRGVATWETGELQAVTGLPTGFRRPGSLSVDGATVVLVGQDGDDMFQATSTDNMLTWAVSA